MKEMKSGVERNLDENKKLIEKIELAYIMKLPQAE